MFGAVPPEKRFVKLIFSVGGGGFAGALGNYAIVGDWVLEPISGKINDWGITCEQSDGWQCELDTAKGTAMHELGHALGILEHPPIEKDSIMNQHWNYPTVGLLDYEIDYLKSSPYFKKEK